MHQSVPRWTGKAVDIAPSQPWSSCANRRDPSSWFRSYIQTYLARDIRSLSNIRDLATFRRFIALLAARCGQMLNKTNVAGPLGVSVPTISQWLSMLEVTGQIPPFYENFGKRLVKTPKLYFADPGLLCHLLGIPDEKGLRTSPFLGAILENYVAAEVVKHRLNRGKGRDLYYFRDRQGLEVDFLLDRGNRKVSLLEVKATRISLPGCDRHPVPLRCPVAGVATLRTSDRG